MSFDGVNPSYGIEEEGIGLSLPAIQANNYQPRSLKDKISLCLSEESLDLLEEDVATKLALKPEYSNFGEDDVTVFALPDTVRFVVLGIPRLYGLHKESGEISKLVKGENLKQAGKVTCTRLTMAMLCPDGDFVRDGEGKPQMFGLKLKSTKTSLVSSLKNDPDSKTLMDLKIALQKHFKARNVSLLHLVSVSLVASPRRFTSKLSNESSLGTIFELTGGARPLPENLQAETSDLFKDEETKALILDPFGLENLESKPQTAEAAEEEEEEDFDNIPF